VIMDVRRFLEWARDDDLLVEIKQSVDPYLESARLIFALDGKPVLFSRLSGHPGWRLLSGMCAQRKTFAAALGCSVPELVPRLAEALKAPQPPPLLDRGPCQEVVEPVDLTRLPIPRYHREDGGPYITAGVSTVKDPVFGRNISFHRLMVLDETRFTARIVEGRGTHTALTRVDGDLPVAIAVGAPVQVLLAAAMSPDKEVDELGIAHALVPTPLVRCQTVDLEIPATAELVLEGRITGELADEGPFPDLTGTMDRIRKQPVIKIDHVTHRRDPIFHALLPSGMEHKNLMGMPREPTIFAAVNDVCRCKGVYVTPGGMSWLHAVIQIDKQDDEDGLRAIEAAFRGHTSLKHVVVVDKDVDLYDSGHVEWAIATRFQADRDLIVFHDQPSSSLDPSASQTPGQKARTAKMGLDATIPAGEARSSYEPVTYQRVDLAQYGVES
jgi:UbiD family decarboxylase